MNRFAGGSHPPSGDTIRESYRMLNSITSNFSSLFNSSPAYLAPIPPSVVTGGLGLAGSSAPSGVLAPQNLKSVTGGCMPMQSPACQGPGSSTPGCLHSVAQIIQQLVQMVQQIVTTMAGMLGKGTTSAAPSQTTGELNASSNPTSAGASTPLSSGNPPSGTSSPTASTESSDKPSLDWKSLIDIGTTILSFINPIAGGITAIIGKLGSLFKGGTKGLLGQVGGIGGIFKKGLALFG